MDLLVDDYSIGLTSNPVTFDFRKPDGTLIASYTRDLTIPVSLWARLDRLEIDVSASAVESYPDGSEVDLLAHRHRLDHGAPGGLLLPRLRGDRLQAAARHRRLRGRQLPASAAALAALDAADRLRPRHARINDCLPDCADGAFHRAPIAVRLTRLRRCRGAKLYGYTRLSWRYLGRLPFSGIKRRGRVATPCDGYSRRRPDAARAQRQNTFTHCSGLPFARLGSLRRPDARNRIDAEVVVVASLFAGGGCRARRPRCRRRRCRRRRSPTPTVPVGAGSTWMPSSRAPSTRLRRSTLSAPKKTSMPVQVLRNRLPTTTFRLESAGPMPVGG